MQTVALAARVVGAFPSKGNGFAPSPEGGRLWGSSKPKSRCVLRVFSPNDNVDPCGLEPYRLDPYVATGLEPYESSLKVTITSQSPHSYLTVTSQLLHSYVMEKPN